MDAVRDLFGSRGIPLHLAEHIFYLAGPGALTSVRCTNKTNAEAYSGVALSLARRGQWLCRADSPELLQFAVEHRLRCLRFAPNSINSTSRPQVATLEWLRELYIDYTYNSRLTFADNFELPPRLAVLELKNLRLQALPPLPDATLERLVWCEPGGAELVFRTGPLPSSLLHLQCDLGSPIELPDLPPFLQHLDLGHSLLSTGTLPTLPATLKHLSCVHCNLTHLPDDLPPSLVHLDCASNRLPALPALLPLQLRHFTCSYNRLTILPVLPDTLQHLDCSFNALTAPLPDLPDSLVHLDCHRNHLTALPALPARLTHLDCSNNPLVGFPDPLPPGL